MRTRRPTAGFTAGMILASTSLLVASAAQALSVESPSQEVDIAEGADIAATAAAVHHPPADPGGGDPSGAEDAAVEKGSGGLFAGDATELAPTMAALRHCESGGDYRTNTGNGYYGAYQFEPETWWGLGYGGWPHEAAPGVQDEAAITLYERSGWHPWPGCALALALQ